jgi:hypothetical protein
VAVQSGDPGSFLSLYLAALLASGPLGADNAGVVTLPRDTAVWLAG